MYDAIVIGARAAGSSTGMLLARKGCRVLVVDRASFPSDTLSTHQVQLPGVARLKRWGLLDKVIATQAPATRRVRFDPGFTVLEGLYPEFEGVDTLYSPRRTYLDKILVDAAREAGAELREAFVVDEVIFEGRQVIGIRGHDKNGAEVVEKASITIGADGRHSLLARAVEAPVYAEKPVLSCGYYSYFSGVENQGGEIYTRGRRSIGLWPTNDGLAILYVAWPVAEFNDFRTDVEKNYLGTIELVPGLAERIHAGRREERIYGTADMPNFFRKPYGPGWALVGDAGYMKDALTGQGISDAFRDAELLVEAVAAGLSGRQTLEAGLAAYENQRNAAALPMYEFTTDLAALKPPAVEQQVFLSALSRRPELVSRFLGILTGAVPPSALFNPAKIFKVVGVSGMARIMASKMLNRTPKASSIPGPSLS